MTGGVIGAFETATRAIAELQSVDDVLQVIVDQVRILVGAPYAALGIVDADGVMERFITTGMDGATRARIGALPRGHGLLGLIVRENQSFRIPDIAVDPNPDPVTGQRGSVYIADGYGNHRVVVFDRAGNYLRQFGSIGSGPGQFTAGDGGHPHCVVLGRDGYVYACDRGQDRINVFTKTGELVKVMPIIPGTAALGVAGSAWDIDFSPDAIQKFAYVSDGANEVMWIFNHADALNGSAYVPPLSGFGAGVLP